MRPGAMRKINHHARNAIENNAEWGSDVHAKVGAALLQIFLQATEVAPVRRNATPLICWLFRILQISMDKRPVWGVVDTYHVV